MNLTETLIMRRDALNAIIAQHSNPTHALDAIATYCDDPAAISSPSLLDNLTIFFRDKDEEITSAGELIYLIGGIDLGTEFCIMNELCARCFTHLDICDCSTS